jgi:transcriptional regulator with XRE-family HTH domain
MDLTQIIETAKTRAGLESDRQLAKLLEVSHGAPHHWRKGTARPSIEHAHRLAELAGLDPAKVVAEVLIESAESPALIKTLQRFLAAALVGVVCILCQMFASHKLTLKSISP